MDFTGTSGDSLLHMNDFQVQDFIDDQNIDQFIDLIRGESHHQEHVVNLDTNFVNGYMVENQLPQMSREIFDYNNNNATMGINGCPNIVNFHGENNEEEEDSDMEEDSAGTTANTCSASKRSKKADRSRTLVSERRRRGRMKEKLYALRSLVPNITKMDKASIIGDAVQYIQDQQSRAKKLKAEIAGLEASLVGTETYQRSTENEKKFQLEQNILPISKSILQIDVFQVEERGFYVKVVCNKGQGVAMSLYKALESLTSYNVQSSNLDMQSERYTFTFTLHVKESEPDMNLPNLKLWVTGALLNQGFELEHHYVLK